MSVISRRIGGDKQRSLRVLGSSLTKGRVISRKGLFSTKVMECKKCGSVDGIICHHLDKDPLNTSLSNLVWLCESCHSKKHNRKLPRFFNNGVRFINKDGRIIDW